MNGGETKVKAATDWSSVPTRLGSAAVIAVIVGVCLWFGGLVWGIAILLMGLRMGFEWTRMSSGAKWLLVGALYVVLPLVAMVWIRGGGVGLDAPGFRMAAFVILVVIAADAGAYFSGKAIGGPKMAPKLSPNKTWAGFCGGMVLGALLGGGLAVLWSGNFVAGIIFAAALVVAAVAGDFLESGFKRHFGVKDTGSILPGHGGVLDRVDSHMAAFAVAALVLWLAPSLSPI